MNNFDPVEHSYAIAGRRVPSVTQIIRAILGDAIWSASDWYLERGRAVHACAAMIARGPAFTHDPQITGQVAACRQFFQDVKPEVIEVEAPVFSETYQFAGTFDLLARIAGKFCIVDYKSALHEIAKIQIGAYSILRPQTHHGMIVQLSEDGRYKTTGIIKIDRYRNEFLALRSVYGIRQRLGLFETKKEGNDGN